MCNKEDLVAYLYDDLSASDRAAFEAHVEGCVACSRELQQLRDTRQLLASWAPPDPRFDIRVVPRAEPLRPRRLAAVVPAWGLAAAASLLLLAGAAAIANVEMRLGSDGVVLRTGWAATSDAPPVSEPIDSGGVAAAELAPKILALEERLRELEALRTAAEGAVPAASTDPASGTVAADALEARLRGLIADSERRQRTDVALQMTQMWKDLNAVRASDFVRVQESLAQVQGQTNYQLRQHRDSIESLYRVSLRR